MSGREHEPVASFFPSIDRNLIRDLDRHLRNASPLQEPTFTPAPKLPPATLLLPPEPAATVPHTPVPRPGTRPNIAGVLEAVENAAHSMAAMTARIEELEAHIESTETANEQLEVQLGEADQANRELDAKLKEETARADRSDALNEQQAARVVELERELSTVHSDLARVTEAITAALGLPHN